MANSTDKSFPISPELLEQLKRQPKGTTVGELLKRQPPAEPTGADRSMVINPGAQRTRDVMGVPTVLGNPIWRYGMQNPPPVERSLKRGGTVRKTGTYKLHKGEKVIPARAAKAAPKRPAATAPRRKK